MSHAPPPVLLQLIQSNPGVSGPFAALSLIVAPAILTNAASLLVMSTSNRLARAVDLGRELSRELEASTAATDTGGPETTRRLRELAGADTRSLLLVRALRAVYTATAGFATATLTSVVGVVLARSTPTAGVPVLETVAILAAAIGVAGIVWAAVLLVRETRIAVTTMRQRIAAQQERFQHVHT